MNRTAVTKNLNNPFAALRHKNFGIYWSGMCISLIGTWMQNIAQPWLAYQLTDSPFLLSLVSAMQFIPMLLFSLFAGVIVDRLPKKKLLIFTQTASLGVTLLLALLTYMGQVQYWHILILAAVLGIVNTLDMPARQAFIIELVGKDDLMNAIALNSSAFNLARIIGPALAALVMANFGVASCFLVNSITFAAVIVGLFFIKPRTTEIAAAAGSIFHNISDGLRYLVREKEIFDVALRLGIVSMFGMNFTVLIPVFTTRVLGQGEASYGLLMALMGIGSFVGALLIAAMSRNGPKPFVLMVSPLIISVMLILMGYASDFFVASAILIVNGFFFIMFSSTCNTALQLKTKNEYRGRIMSIYALMFTGLSPLGNLVGGVVTDRFHVGAGFIVSGICILVPILILYLVRSVLAGREES